MATSPSRRHLFRPCTVAKIHKGFTLVELLLVVVVIAMIVLVILPPLRAAREKARRTSCMCNLKQIGLAVRLYSGDNQQRFPTDITWTTKASWALLTNRYQTSHRTWTCPSDTGIASCGATSGLVPNPFTANLVSYAYGGFGLTESTQPDTPIACDRTSGEVTGVTPYTSNEWTHQSDGGNVLFADGHVAFQKTFVPPMYRGKNP